MGYKKQGLRGLGRSSWSKAWPRASGATNLSKLEPRITHPGSGARAAFSVALVAEAPGTAPCDRLRWFLRPGLGPGFSQIIRSLSVSVRLSRHTDRGRGAPGGQASSRSCSVGEPPRCNTH